MIIALDLETTGLDKKEDKIIELALVKFDENTFEIIEEYSTFVDPEMPIPEISSNITSIFDVDVKNAPKIQDILIDIENFIGDLPILGHNVEFDKGFLVQNGVDIVDNVALDTFFLANFLLTDSSSLSLESISSDLGISLKGAHRALNDTKATIKVFEKLIKKISKFTEEKKRIFSFITGQSNVPQIEWLNNYFDFEDDLQQDKLIKILLKKIKKYKKQEDFTPNPDLAVKFEKSYFDKLDNFELRENQLKMGNLVADSFSNDKKIVIEAPTGVGKTFAYLLPSILYSLKKGEQVFISTNTKALQDQIIFKDLDFFTKNLDLNFSFSKLKGRKNYIGVLPFFTFLFDNQVFDKPRVGFILKIIYWLYSTKDGELDELNYYFEEFSYKKEIDADNPLVLKDENEFLYNEYLFKARTKAQKSNIVIINHSLLLQDITNENSLFGNIKNLVIDEAHNLEDVATNSLKKFASLNILEGALDNIERILLKEKIEIPNLEDQKNSIILIAGMIFENVKKYIFTKPFLNTYFPTTLIESDFFSSSNETVAFLSSLEIKIIDLINSLAITEDKAYSALSGEILILETVLSTLKIAFLEDSIKKYIPIAAYSEKVGVIVSQTLLDPGVFIKEKLWDNLDSCVITSATLKINNNFDYINRILSLEEGFEFTYLQSDFDYSKQALLFIPDNLGSIKNNQALVNDFLKKLFSIVKGKSMSLFTSFSAIKSVYLDLNIPLKKLGVNILAQSIGGGKHKLIDMFKKNSKSSVLLGTDTFWEGIDIPGDDLEILVMHKFPFMVPSDPVFKARSKLFKNDFSEYSIPKAILKLKQGFGRLIRTKEDKGIVILLDDRIYSSKWGEKMYSSFPSDIKIRRGGAEELLTVLEKKHIKK